MAAKAESKSGPKKVALSVFKNGYALVEKHFEVTDENVKQETETGFWTFSLDVPSHAVYGSLNVDVNPECEIHSICAQKTEVAKEEPCLSIHQLIEANQAVPLVLHLSSELALPDGRRVREVPISSVVALSTALVIVKVGEDQVALPLALVQAVSKPDGPLSSSLAVTSTRNSLVVRTLNKPTTINLRYITSGITWVPSYSLDLELTPAPEASSSSPPTGDLDEIGGSVHLLPPSSSPIQKRIGRIGMRALLMNDVEGNDEDISHLIHDVSCIAGQPNIRFSSVLDPISSDALVGTFMSQLSGASSASAAARGTRTNRLVGQQMQMMNSFAASSSGWDGGVAPPGQECATDAGSDFFRYRFRNVKLPKRGRTALPVFTKAHVIYEDYYEVTIPARSQRPWEKRDDDDPLDVIHYVQFRNSTVVPWTTAPISTFVNGEFTSQDMVSFTPSGGLTKVKLTAAVNVGCTISEEVQGEPRPFTHTAGHRLVEYKVAATISLKNLTAEPVKVNLKKELLGKLITDEFNPQPNSVSRPPHTSGYHHDQNPQQSVTYEIIVPAQKTTSVSFAYHFVSS